MNKSLFFLFLSLCMAVSTLAQNLINTRYRSSQLFGSDLTEDVEFDVADIDLIPALENEAIYLSNSLKMDIYTPANDNFKKKPAVLLLHGGGFIFGSKSSNDMQLFADSLSKRGYFVASIEYRLGINIADGRSPMRAIYRANQDARMAIRYLRANTAMYGIDPNHIYILGQSAGAITALNNLYLDDSELHSDNDAYSYLLLSVPDLGPIDIGQNLSYSGRANACISLWGAVQHDSIISKNDTTPLLLIHGKSDGIVPFEIGRPFGGAAFTIDPTYGSSPIHEHMDSLNIAHETYFVDGEGHEFYGGVTNGNFGFTPNAYWDTIFDKTQEFMYNQHKPTAQFQSTQSVVTTYFTDLSAKAVKWFWDFGDSNFSIQQNPAHIYAQPGNYTVKLTVQSEHLSWDTISQMVYVGTASIAKIDDNISEVYVYDNQLNVTAKTPDVLHLYATSGQLMDVFTIQNGKNIHNLSSLAKGIYFVKSTTSSFYYKLSIR